MRVISQYLGDWYTYATTPGFFQPTGTECQRAQYGLLPNGTVSVYNVAMLNGSGPGPGDMLIYYTITERQIKVCTWLRENSFCSCLTVLSCPAWVMLI